MSEPSSPPPGPPQPPGDLERPPRLRPWRWWPVVGATVGAAAGLAYYFLWGCDSG